MRRPTKSIPTDEEILSYPNVPVDVACRYLGTSSPTLYYALQDERAPFGFAVKSPKGGWTYNISPGALVKYKHGELPSWRLKEIERTMVDGVEKIIAARTEMAIDALRNVV